MNTNDHYSGPDEPTHHADDPGELSEADVPERIGPYRLISKLGQGGMGSVFLAEQTEPVQRQVALKLLSEAADRRNLLVRFEIECQVLAQLHHPCIGQIYDAGISAGRPWLAMEHVDGIDILGHCEQYDLSLAERLRLFVRVCHGVLHAHQHGILHRDLKPGNILVSRIDGQSQPCIIDFGIATSLDQLGRGGKGERVAGTRPYMSPERLANPGNGSDIRDDIYALAVILFEMLTACRPPVASNTGQLERFLGVLRSRHPGQAIDDIDLTEWITVSRELPHELRCIIARALAPDAEARYPTVRALIDDIERYQNDLPVEAVPPSRAYRWHKFLWRHRWGASFAGAFALLLVVGISVSLWAMLDAQAQRDRAELEGERASQIMTFLESMLDQVDPDYAMGADTVLLQRMLDDAATRVDQELADQPEVERAVQFIIGRTYHAIGRFDEALAHIRRAIKLSAQEPTSNVHIAARKKLLSHQMHRQDLETNLTELRQLLELAELGPGPNSYHAIDVLRLKGQLLLASGDVQAATAHLDEIDSRLAGTFTRALEPVVIDVLLLRNAVYRARARLDDAAAMVDQALEIIRDSDYQETRKKLGLALQSKVLLMLEQRQFGRAEPLLKEIIDDWTDRYGTDSMKLIAPISNLASAVRQQGRLEEASDLFDDALRLGRLHLNEHSIDFLGLRYNQANLLRELGQTEIALAQHREVIAAAHDHLSPEHFYYPIMHVGLGQSLLQADQNEEAAQVLEYAVHRLSDTLGAEAIRTLEAIEHLVEALNRIGRLEEAQQWSRHLEASTTHPPSI